MADRSIKVDCGCSCKCGNAFGIEIWLEEDADYCFLSSYASVFSLKQDSFFNVWKSRIKAAWHMLMGKEYCLHEVCLSREQYNRLLDSLNKFREETPNAKP